jgi:putative DNA repair-like protein
MFQGTVSETSVSIREIIRQALKLNASAIIIGHNHPTGNVEPSEADRHITKRLKEVCELMEIKLLDHFIVSGSASFCFTDNHLM